jgi:pyruvate,orthophosphate dikinase
MSAAFDTAFIGCPRQTTPVADDRSLGFKAANLARMSLLGLPVPPAFVLPTARCAAALKGSPQESLAQDLARAVHVLEQATSMELGGSRRPLCVSVRSGAPVSMPGMMDTVLNIGLNDESVRGLVRLTGNARLAWDCYRRLVQSYAEIVHQRPRAPFESMLDAALATHDAASLRELDHGALRELTHACLAHFERDVGMPFPQDPQQQLECAVRAVWRSWTSDRAVTYRRLHGIADEMGTAVTVQQMVYGNAGGASGAGVGFTRNPADGAAELYLDFLFDAQGEDVVSGRHDANDAGRLAALAPRVFADVQRAAATLEQSMHDMQEFEFTVSLGQLYLLQTRPGKRTAWAALHIALDLADEGVIDTDEALARIEPLQPDTITRTIVEPGTNARVLARATSAGLGTASGRIALDTAAAQRTAADGPVILVRDETVTDDIAGMAAAAGILTARGGRTSHAAVIARQLERVCLVGCVVLRIDPEARTATFGDVVLREGDVVSLDGDTGTVFAGAVAVRTERPVAALERLRSLAAPPTRAQPHQVHEAATHRA